MSIRTCHICGTEELTGECPKCRENFESRQAADSMSIKDRVAELRLLSGPLEIEFDLVHQRIEELVGRPVWTHELANFEQLVDEVRSGETATFADVMGKVPNGKELFVVTRTSQ